jgi:hypothetical protein
MKHTFEMTSCGMMDISIQAKLRVFLRNLRGYNVGITDERDL